MRKLWAVALLTGGLAVVVPAPVQAAATEFSSGFESGQPQPTWTNTVDSSAGVGGYCCGLTGMESGTRTEAAHTGSSPAPPRSPASSPRRRRSACTR